MTWPDIVLLVVFVIFLAMGAKLGSLWTAACLGGGFVGAYLADVYALPAAAYLPRVPGAPAISGAVLFLAGVGAVLLPGWLLSKAVHGVFLGVVDGIVGFVTGGLVGLTAVTLVLLALVSSFPKIERAEAWKKSFLVRPIHDNVETWLNRGENLRLPRFLHR